MRKKIRGPLKNLIGLKVNRLLVLSRAKKIKGDKARYWICLCSCGIKKRIETKCLTSGKKQISCGCFHKEVVSKLFKKHGFSLDHSMRREYSTWTGIKARCFNKNHDFYHLYGGRGITVCFGWREDFDVFFKDMGKKPLGLSIDRIDVNGNYSCGKCSECKKMKWQLNAKWSNAKEQGMNKRNNRIVVFNGNKRVFSDLCKEYGHISQVVSSRIKSGWRIKKALETPVLYRWKK